MTPYIKLVNNKFRLACGCCNSTDLQVVPVDGLPHNYVIECQNNCNVKGGNNLVCGHYLGMMDFIERDSKGNKSIYTQMVIDVLSYLSANSNQPEITSTYNKLILAAIIEKKFNCTVKKIERKELSYHLECQTNDTTFYIKVKDGGVLFIRDSLTDVWTRIKDIILK